MSGCLTVLTGNKQLVARAYYGLTTWFYTRADLLMQTRMSWN